VLGWLSDTSGRAGVPLPRGEKKYGEALEVILDKIRSHSSRERSAPTGA
jgi:hypothetical protein